MMKVWSLFLDDERFPPDDGREWKIARTHQEVVDLVELHGMPSYVSFDHDLGDLIPNGDGYQVAKHLCALDAYPQYRFPEGFDYYVHSQNPVGRDNIIGYMSSYFKHRESLHLDGSE